MRAIRSTLANSPAVDGDELLTPRGGLRISGQMIVQAAALARNFKSATKKSLWRSAKKMQMTPASDPADRARRVAQIIERCPKLAKLDPELFAQLLTMRRASVACRVPLQQEAAS